MTRVPAKKLVLNLEVQVAEFSIALRVNYDIEVKIAKLQNPTSEGNEVKICEL